jgi:hypothetical protein
LAITVFTPALAGCLLLLSWLQHRRVTALALWGSGFIIASVATTLIIVLRGTIPDFWSIIVGNALLSSAYGILWSGARKFEAKKVSILPALVGVSVWLVACSIGPIYARPEARAMVMAAIGIVYTLLVVFEFWRGRKVPIPIVNTFEAIEIKQDEGHRLARKASPHQQPFAPLEEAATVRSAGQWISHGGAPIACGNPILGEAPE